MIKKYFPFLLLIFWFSTFSFGYSQTVETLVSTNNTIEGLTLYPNPATNGKLYISTLKNLIKQVEIYDVLGKKVYTISLYGNAVDISNLKAGVYVVKITENSVTITKKLVVK